MATTYPALLVGGPCNGVVRQLTADALRNGRLWCQGQLYIGLTAAENGTDYRYAFEYQPDYIKAHSQGNELTAMHAWTRWMHALGHSGPQAHNRMQRATARARRIAR